jgi:hypothetical protein
VRRERLELDERRRVVVVRLPDRHGDRVRDLVGEQSLELALFVLDVLDHEDARVVLEQVLARVARPRGRGADGAC